MEKVKSGVSEAQKRATMKYDKKAYYHVNLRIPAALESDVRTAAAALTEGSINGFILCAIREKLERDFYK